MNRIFIVGNLTADPDYSVSAQGVPVSHFNVADNYYVGGEQKANFYRVTAFRNMADNCHKYLAKGRKVAIVGKVQQGEYTDNTGAKVRTFDVLADDLQFLSPAEDREPGASSANSTKQFGTLQPVDDAGLPF